MTAEQERYLAEGIRHRARYNGFESTPLGGHLTLALAWWAAWWREQADRAEARNADRVTRDMFDDAGDD